MVALVCSGGRRLRVGPVLCLILLFCTPVLAVVANWKSMGPPGGTITCIAVSPADSGIVLAGTNGADILRSTDGGQTWKFSRQGIVNGYITGVKFSRSDPSVVYLATYYGVCKSTDAGATWTTFASAPLNEYILASIDVSVTDPNIVYAASPYAGPYKTTDGGSSWRSLSSPLFTGADVVFVDRSDTNTVFAADYRAVYKSTDGGGRWVRKTSFLSYAPWFSCFESRADGGVLYAGSSRGGVFRSTDRGNSWISIASALTNTFVYALAVDPQSGAVYAANYSAGVSKSTDNGQTWTVSKQGLTSLDFIALGIDPGHPANLYSTTFGELFKSTDSAASWTCLSARFTAHVISDILIDSRTEPAPIYAGTAGGVYRTTNRGQTWTNASEGLGNKQVTALLLGASAETLYAATQGGFYRTTNGGSAWTGLNNGLASTILYDLAAVPGSDTFYAASQGGIFKTTDAGNNWARIGLNGGYVFVLTIDPQQPARLYAFAYLYPSGYGLYKSTDSGATWGVLNLPDSQSYISSIAVDPTQADTIYAVVSGSGVLKSTDGGTSWKSANTGQPYAFGSITADPRSPGVLYLGTFGCVYRSDDRAEHWLPFGTSFSDSQVTVVVPEGDKEIWVGTNAGIFSSDSSNQFRAFFPFCRHSAEQLTGFAISNAGDQTASLELRLFGSEGQLVDAPRNPATGTLAGKRQSALLANEIFGFAANTEVSGWAELTSSVPLPGFFQVVGQGLDGGVAFTKSLKEFCVTRILDGPDAFRNKPAAAWLQIANPGVDPVTVQLQLLSMSGAKVAEKTLDIPAHGFRSGSLADLFAPPADFRIGFVTGKVTKGEGVIGFACIRLGNEGTIIGVNAAEASTRQTLFSGQMAAGPGVFSSFRIANVSAAVRHVTLYAIDEAGAPLVSPVVVDIPPLSAFEQDAADLFGFPASSLVVGSFRVESDGPGLLGDVVFGEPEKLVLAAAMPLQDELFRRVVFSQVANGMGLFTGLAFCVPGTESATVSIDVYSAEGLKTGQTQFVMAGGSRQSRLLTEFVPSTAGQIRGFVVVNSTQPLVAQELFAGADSMSAVPGVAVVE